MYFISKCRLRKLLTDEETQFEAEFQLAMSRRIENDIEARRDHLLSLKIEREEKRKRFVEDKRMQLIMFALCLLNILKFIFIIRTSLS